MSEDKFLEVAKKAAIEAGKIITKYSGKTYKKNIKHGDSSNFATEADLEAEEVIVGILTHNFPDHNILAEESGKLNKGSNYTWVIDPLDGTLTFSNNIPYFTVSIGLLKDDKPLFGIINHVGFGNLYWAQSGKGAFVNGERISVSKKQILEDAICTLELGHRQQRKQKMDLYVNKLVTKVGYLYQFGSAAVTLALVAQGTLDFYISEAFIWDFAAAAVIVKEAGGKVTDLNGNEPDWTKKRFDLVASNGLIHEQILEALKNSD